MKANELHEGHWRVAVEFGTAAGFNAQMPGGATLPSVWVPVMGLALVEEPEPTDLTVDASVINPRSHILVTTKMPGEPTRRQ